MWYRLGQFILKQRVFFIAFLLLITIVLGFFASQVKMSYEFTKAIPEDNPKYAVYHAFVKKFGVDGTTMVVGFESKNLFKKENFNLLIATQNTLKQIPGVTDVLSIANAYAIQKDTINTKFVAKKVFKDQYFNDDSLQQDARLFEALPLYKNLLYNPESSAYVMSISFKPDSINSGSRTHLIAEVQHELDQFQNATHFELHKSGMPFIRTILADRMKKEMIFFLVGSLLLSAITLLLFFRSFSAMLMSLGVVAMGVIWSFGTMVLLGQKITLLTALIPPLVVVIGVPNCIYFLNKYHTSYKETNDKNQALVNTVGKMGVVTLFCNITAAIGFFVFAFTKSPLLKEFGWVSGINIMALFFISLFFIPPVLSYMSLPKAKHVRYLENKFLTNILVKIEKWTFDHTKWVFAVTIAFVLIASLGVRVIKKEAFIVDDLPKKDQLFTDLKWFEKTAGGVMPLEIVIDTKKKNGLTRTLQPLQRIDELNSFLLTQPELGKPLGLLEGVKFGKQAFYDGDSSSFSIPTATELAFMSPYLSFKKDTTNKAKGPTEMLTKFIDKDKQATRISVNMKDIGSAKLPAFLNRIDSATNNIFDSTKYHVEITGSSVTFLEGSNFIIKGLGESIFWAFLLIAICMLFLFRSFPILICSLIPNIVPLFITAGIMGWVGVPLKPSTVLVFSVVLGIAVDVTIRFLVNYKQELPHLNNNVHVTLTQTIRHTGISIIYTSLVLVAGFVIFCASDFGGTKALGWLTSLTLVTSTLTNLILLPALIKKFIK